MVGNKKIKLCNSDNNYKQGELLFVYFESTKGNWKKVYILMTNIIELIILNLIAFIVLEWSTVKKLNLHGKKLWYFK